MAVEELKKTLVLGHRNPDTDSICSAICYAGFKHQLTGENYEPCRAGNVNPETQYVLDYFKLKAPRLVENVKTQVKDIEIRKTKGVSRGISLKNAWGLMQENNVVTLPCVTEEGLLEGVITIGDITKSYMNLYDSSIISKACTKYANILDTLEGSMVVGDSEAYFDRGKVLIAAANPDLMENYIEKHDLSSSETVMSPSFAPSRWKQAALSSARAQVYPLRSANWHRSAAVQSLRHRMTPTQQPV